MKNARIKRVLSAVLALVMIVSAFSAAVPVKAADTKPAAVNIGHPTFKNTDLLEPIYDLASLGVSYGSNDIMMDIYKQDLANGGDSFYFDRVLSRTGVANGNANNNGNADGNTFLTRGRALYMYTSTPSVIGFGGNTAYHQPLGAGNLVTVTFALSSGTNLNSSENTANRVNQPSNWSSNYRLGNTSYALNADVTKFISQENVAVTAITVNNTGTEDREIVVTATSPFVSEKSTVEVGGKVVEELVGSVKSPSSLTTITPRMTGDGFTYGTAEGTMVRTINVPAGQSVDVKVVITFSTEEIPASTTDYVRFAAMDNLTAIRTQKAEYNLYWAENVPYIDIPNKAVQKAIDYRWWLERFNTVDANIPGYDYQYPITIEGVLGYNNAIVLTQPMHLQDTKWLRSPYLAYGQLLSVGNSSQSSAFLDNPGNRNNWNNHYGQYLGDAGLEAFNVIGGGAEMAKNLAYYFGHDATGQLDHYGNHVSGRSLIAYRNNYMTGNDADTISMNSGTGVGTWKVHGENAYVWAAANAAYELYNMIGDTETAATYKTLADKIQKDILELLWCEQDEKFETYGVSPSNYTRSYGPGHNPDQRNLVKVTESNNWNYFAVGLVPTDEASLAKYVNAFKAFSNGEEFPIFPFYTADQIDNNTIAGSNNFSNINFTVQIRAYEAALRTYDKEQQYITDEMLALICEWMAYNVYPDAGDIRYPNNNEYHNADGKTIETYYRSWIYHNILGNYISYFIEDMAGIQPRADEKIELLPVEFDYDHFMVNNVRYHGHDLTVVLNRAVDGKAYYTDRPVGYSLYIDGELAFTLADIADVIYDTVTGTLEFVDETAKVEVITLGTTASIPTSLNTVITDARTLELMEKSGMYGLTNLAEGAKVTASFTPTTARAASWAEKHRADGSDSTSKAVNEEKPDPQAVTDGTTVNMPFWGNYGTNNTTDTLVLNLGEAKKVDMATLYFYNDRQNGGYAEPAHYSVEYWTGSEWKSVTKQDRIPAQPVANLNKVTFEAVTTDQFRFTFTNLDGKYTAVTEIQLFFEDGDRTATPENTAPSAVLSEVSAMKGNLHTGVKAVVTDDGRPFDMQPSYLWEVVAKPEGATTVLTDANKLTASLSGSEAGDYTLRFTVSDGELSATAEITVNLDVVFATLGADIAPDAINVESDYTSGWENLNGINNPDFEPGSSNVGTGKGWGNWSQTVGSEHYVGYTWSSPVTIGGSDVYWYDDGGGTQIPGSIRMAYMDENGQWQDVELLTAYEDSIAKNKYNRINFTPVTTTRLRLYVTVKAGAAANGIYRFKVYPTIDIAALDTVHVATKTGVIPTLPTTINAWNTNGNLISATVSWETITDDMVANDATFTINGVNADSGKMTTATVYVRSDMDMATITDVEPVEITTNIGVIPTLPKTVKVGYNNGAYDNQSITVTWPTLTANDVAKAGTYTFEADVPGTGTKARLILKVVDPNASEAYLEVIKLIEAIATAEDKEAAIAAARAAYNELDPEDQAKVTNYLDLVKAEAVLTLDKLVADRDCTYITEKAAALIVEAKAAVAAAETEEAVAEVLARYTEELTVALGCLSGKLRDVEVGTWYHDSVDFMIEKGYMVGISAYEFGTNYNLTRAELVTVLYRVAGRPDVSELAPIAFTDVPAGTWYTDAVRWAAANGIVSGTSATTFAPGGKASREQIASIVYRFARYQGLDIEKRAELTDFTDAGSVSSWAVESVKWAVAEGIISGNGSGKLNPKADATRAEVASVLARYIQKLG